MNASQASHFTRFLSNSLKKRSQTSLIAYRGCSTVKEVVVDEGVASVSSPPPVKQSSAKSKPPPRQPVTFREEDIVEKFSRGSGPGGQAVAKTSNRVQLTYLPLNLTFTCHEHRSLAMNRSLARKKLVEHLDLMVNKEQSKKAKRTAKARKRKAKAARRAKEKYGETAVGVEEEELSANSMKPKDVKARAMKSDPVKKEGEEKEDSDSDSDSSDEEKETDHDGDDDDDEEDDDEDEGEKEGEPDDVIR